MSEQAPSVIELGARAIAKSYGHDPDEMAPTLVMCTADNHPVPYWQVYEEQAEACLAAARASSEPQAPSDSLLPCPFCGGDAVDRREIDGFPMVYCDGEECFGPQTTAKTFQDAMVQWNTRAPLPRLSDETVEVREEEMSLRIALDFAEHPRPHPSLQAPADTMEELREALRALAKAYREALPSDESAGVREALEKFAKWADDFEKVYGGKLANDILVAADGDSQIFLSDLRLARTALALLQTESKA